MPATARKPHFRPENIAFALASVRRWRIFQELSKGQALPLSEIARRTGLSLNAASKVLSRFHDAGFLERGFGKLYTLSAQLLSANEHAIDFGPIVLRLDAPTTPPK